MKTLENLPLLDNISNIRDLELMTLGYLRI